MSRQRRRAVALLAVTALLGIVSRKVPIGLYIYDEALGDVLYAVAAYLSLILTFCWSVERAAPRAFAACVLVELFKLTGIPAAYRHVPLVPWVFGVSFSWQNLACYALGVALVAYADRAFLYDATGAAVAGTGLVSTGGRTDGVTQMQRVVAAVTHEVAVAEAESREVRDGQPFGGLYADWKSFISRMAPGDRLCAFRTPEETWSASPPRGMMGYVILRGGMAVEVFFTRID